MDNFIHFTTHPNLTRVGFKTEWQRSSVRCLSPLPPFTSSFSQGLADAHPPSINSRVFDDNMMDNPRYSCCCIPVGVVVFISSLLSLILSSFAAGMFFWFIHSA